MAKREQTADEREPIPGHLLAPNFDDIKGDEFGGSSTILMLEVDEAAGPLTYVGHRLTDLGNNIKPADIHEAKDKAGELWRLPIATNFQRNAEGANLQAGDTFYVKRLEDVEKKAGAGKGNMMQMYVIKVTARAKAPVV